MTSRLQPISRSILLCLVIAACSPAPPDADEAQAEAERVARIDLSRTETKAVSGIARDVRIEMLERRAAELEREVGMLTATPDKLELELLARRVAELETRAVASAETMLPPRERASAGPSLAPTEGDIAGAAAAAQRELRRRSEASKK